MKEEYKFRRVYLFRDGVFQETDFGKVTPFVYDKGSDGLRHKRRLMLELTRRGDIYLYFGDNKLHLTKEQIESIIRFRKDNKVSKK